MKYQYITSGTCSKQINIELAEDGTVQNIKFLGGCNGNLQGIAAMARGMRPIDVAQRLRGIKCGSKDTSCPDQLALALESLIIDKQ